ncbi:hypothetical protein BLNAU_17551 [Blattamonas nauphoetae]|uniref:Uncharacterized protein n=1 Tax=Blattamonas nauphoetae TaxID=2049346 RepID=A0ABQ9XB69_9EUKA|nr:hypothetical protein BLNAU_17551 [Blattamonas nauphoetae]
MLLQYQQRCVGEHSILPASSEMQVREVQNVHSFQVHGPSSIRRQAVGNENVGYFSKKCGEKQRTVGICIRLVKKAICHHCGAGSGDVNAAAFKAEHVPPELCRTFSE